MRGVSAARYSVFGADPLDAAHGHGAGRYANLRDAEWEVQDSRRTLARTTAR